MAKKTYTILVSSNRKGETKTLTISAAWLKMSIFLSGLAFVLFSAGVVDYVGLLLQAGENKRLKAEANFLKRQFRVVEGKLGALEKSLEQVSIFTKKLRIITNIEDMDREVNTTVGPMPKLGQNMPGYNEEGFFNPRNPASNSFVANDKPHMQFAKPILDIESGEIAASSGRDYSRLSIRIDRSVKASKLQEQGVIALLGTLAERQSLLDSTPSIKPTRGWFTSRFGYRLDPFTGKPQMHNGLDFAAPPGTPVHAPADGVVSYVGYESGYGKLVSIDHGYGVVTRYAHNSQVFVEVGQKVGRRDVISAVGTTGRSTGSHLHYEVRVHGVPVDPFNYVLDE